MKDKENSCQVRLTISQYERLSVYRYPDLPEGYDKKNAFIKEKSALFKDKPKYAAGFNKAWRIITKTDHGTIILRL